MTQPRSLMVALSAQGESPTANMRLNTALDELNALLDAANDTPFAQMPALLDAMQKQCDRARGAAWAINGPRRMQHDG